VEFGGILRKEQSNHWKHYCCWSLPVSCDGEHGSTLLLLEPTSLLRWRAWFWGWKM